VIEMTIAIAASLGGLFIVGLVGVADGWMTWGDDYWKYGRMGCALRDAQSGRDLG
jgi:hypothetical protein